jgi:ABC-2 type transport system permease protein
MQTNIPVELFNIANLSPGIAVFGLSFITLFSATLIAKDKESALMQRLYTTPMKPIDFIIGYTLPLIPISLLQSTVCYMIAMLLGLTPSINILWAILLVLPISLIYVSLGLLAGSLLNSKQVGGVCGALLTNLSAWLSGVWFDLELIGGTFKKIAHALPFVHAVEMERAALSGSFTDILPHLLWVMGYAVVLFAAAVYMFLRQMKKQ